VKNPRVSAIEEVGLDTSLRDGTRRVQEDILKEVLQHVKQKHLYFFTSGQQNLIVIQSGYISVL
jgi:Tat protein secretion system quality control protein TatD with DNase activity